MANKFNHELDKLINLPFSEQQKKITPDAANELAKLGRNIPKTQLQTSKPCESLLHNFIAGGKIHQLKQLIECEKYMQYMNSLQSSNSI